MSAVNIHIAVIEPSSVLWEGLTNILLKSGTGYLLYRFEHPEELLNSSLKIRIDLVLLNPVFVSGNPRLLQMLRKALPACKWLALVYSYHDRDLLNQFNDSLQVTDAPEVILSKIEKCTDQAGQNAVSSGKEQLSDRETDVLRCLVNGLSNKEMAEKLNISVHTVISHRKNISQKTGIKSQAGLTIFAISRQIVTLENL